MQRFGEKLRSLRERRGITQQKLAAELGFTHAHLHRLETGKKKPNAELVLKIARLFNVCADVLLKDELELSDD